jgi:ribose/xylose/arabinose/galactoside ABC-type transport system permease subunit
VIGCILLGIVNTALAVLGVSAFWQQAMYGIIILLALIVDKLVQKRMAKV